MALEYRGFRVDVDVKTDEQGMQWLCHSIIEPIDGKSIQNAPLGDELRIPKLKIDPLLAIHTLQRKATVEIDVFYNRLEAIG